MADVKEPEAKTPTPKDKPAEATAKKSSNNKVLFVVLGLAVFFIIIVPAILFFVVFGVLKDKFGNQDKANKTISSLVESASGGNVKVDANGKEITVKGKDGTEISSAQRLPTDWPAAVFIYSPYTVSGSYKTTSDGKTSWTVATTTTDSYDKVKSEIASKYAGWTKSSEYEASGTTVAAYDNDMYSVVLTVSQPSANESKTTVAYSVTQK